MDEEQLKQLRDQVAIAISTGQRLVREFIEENIILGITEAGKTKAVRKAMSEVISCLYTGAFFDAIDELRSIPAELKDGVFISDARILTYINKIEEFCGLPLSESV